MDPTRDRPDAGNKDKDQEKPDFEPVISNIVIQEFIPGKEISKFKENTKDNEARPIDFLEIQQTTLPTENWSHSISATNQLQQTENDGGGRIRTHGSLRYDSIQVSKLR
jgi:hypothetical protein